MKVRGVTQLLVQATCAALVSSTSIAAIAQDASWRHAVDRLAQEKALAEGCASVLKSFADHDPMARVQGQRLYARAKADLDGLIELLTADLAGERSPADVPELGQRLDAVPKQRQTLCRHVDAAVGAALREQATRNRWVDVLTAGSGDAAGSMIDAAVELWMEHRRGDDVRREAITSGLEGTRWQDYAEVPDACAGGTGCALLPFSPGCRTARGAGRTGRRPSAGR